MPRRQGTLNLTMPVPARSHLSHPCMLIFVTAFKEAARRRKIRLREEANARKAEDRRKRVIADEEARRLE